MTPGQAASRVVLTLRCLRGHSLGEVSGTPEGLLLALRYESGRPTRKIGGEVLHTIRFVTTSQVLLQEADAAGPLRVRCRCTDQPLEVDELHAALAANERTLIVTGERSGTV